MILALHFMSGPSKGKEFLLLPEREFMVGFSTEGQWLIDDPGITRPVAVLSTKAPAVAIKDLNSEKGTFVNSDRISRETTLKEGDRIRISGVTCMLVSVTRLSAAFPSLEKQYQLAQPPAAAAPPEPPPPPKRLAVLPGKMAGSIKEIPIVEMLQFLSQSLKSGVLRIVSGNKIGKVYLREGMIYYATLDGRSLVHPRKTLYRILRWTEGTFELEGPDETPFPEEIAEPTSSLLLEGVQQCDELKGLEAELPPDGATLTPSNPLPGRLRDLPPDELDVFQLALEQGTVQGVLDNYPISPHPDFASDLETYILLLAQIRKKYLRLPAAPAPFEGGPPPPA